MPSRGDSCITGLSAHAGPSQLGLGSTKQACGVRWLARASKRVSHPGETEPDEVPSHTRVAHLR